MPGVDASFGDEAGMLSRLCSDWGLLTGMLKD